MKLEDFKSGKYVDGIKYKAFLPNKINHDWSWDDTEINSLSAEANRQLGELNAYSLLIPDVDIFIKMHAKVEANKSSKIEGTRTTIDEDLLDIVDVNPEKKDDWQEVQNYLKAMNYGINKISNNFPLCNRLIREMHAILLNGVRGKNKTPGEFRKSQNWIGGSSINSAQYVPPLASDIEDLLADLESFINNDKTNTPDLIKIAIIHYQFESIHPFLDGNGRIGRLMIPLYLQSKRILEKDCLYLSDYIEKNKDTYYLLLTKVRTENAMLEWVKFILKAIIISADETKTKFREILLFTESMNNEIAKLPIKSDNARKILNALYLNPVIDRKRLIDITGINPSTIKDNINAFVKAGILVESTGLSRNQIFKFEKYINLFI